MFFFYVLPAMVNKDDYIIILSRNECRMLSSVLIAAANDLLSVRLLLHWLTVLLCKVHILHYYYLLFIYLLFSHDLSWLFFVSCILCYRVMVK